MSRRRVKVNGKEYIWANQWYDLETYLPVPQSIVDQIDALFRQEEGQPAALTSPVQHIATTPEKPITASQTFQPSQPRITAHAKTATSTGTFSGALDKPIICPDLNPVFGNGGPVSQSLDKYRPRDGQIAMASIIRDSLQQQRHAIIEAGTGIGKSFAYLIPIIWSQTKAVVSTSNKALMAQLWCQDIPKLKKIAPTPFTATILKGRNNYICLLKLQDFLKNRQLPGLLGDIEIVERGLEEVPSGDCEEVRLPLGLRQRLTVENHQCEGQKCSKFAECLYEKAKAEALKADIVITNHALLCYNILRNDNKIFPIHPVLVIDEAHKLENYAIESLTQILEHNSVIPAIHHSITKAAVDEDIRQQTMEFNHEFFQTIERQRPDKSQQSWALKGDLQEGIALWNNLNQIWQTLQRYSTSERGKLDALLTHVEELVDTVYALAHQESENRIRFCKTSDETETSNYETFQIQHRPLEVSALLKRSLFDSWPRVICTSATLGIAGDLHWLQRRTGLIEHHPQTAIIPSPFDYQKNVVLYTPQEIEPPSPTKKKLVPASFMQDLAYHQEEYLKRLTVEVRNLIEASRGRAFILCTSRKQMFHLYEESCNLVNHLCLCQDKGLSPQDLLERFKGDGAAVLFCTKTFWEGVDVPGEALSLVIIDRIPFLPPEDPVLKRLEQIVAAKHGDPFNELQLGPAIIDLRQGAGRLIRTESDRGVIAILDSRINTKSYSQKVLQSLPNGRRTMQLEDVKRFFAE